MRVLTLLAVAMLTGCAVGADPSSVATELTQDGLEGHRWVFNAELTSFPIPADALAGSEDGFEEVRLRRIGDELVACSCDQEGLAVGVWRIGETHQGGEEQGTVIGGGQQGRARVADRWGQDSNTENDFRPDSYSNDDAGFGINRFGEDLRESFMANLYVFHPGCV